MRRIGLRRYACSDGEEITFSFAADPQDCIQKITFDFLKDDTDPQKVKGEGFSFEVTKNLELVVVYHFDPDQEDGICNVTLTGEDGTTSPDQIDFNPIPPDPIYTFVIR